MIVAFFESIKHVGHLLPVAFLRVFVGYFYLNQALLKYNGDFLTHPKVADAISTAVIQSATADWYKVLLRDYALPHWKVVAGLTVGSELLLGLAYLLGYFVRPMALVGIVLSWVYLSIFPSQEVLYKTFIAIHITFAWLAAGRCLGFDYYFYKRNRGVWW